MISTIRIAFQAATERHQTCTVVVLLGCTRMCPRVAAAAAAAHLDWNRLEETKLISLRTYNNNSGCLSCVMSACMSPIYKFDPAVCMYVVVGLLPAPPLPRSLYIYLSFHTPKNRIKVKHAHELTRFTHTHNVLVVMTHDMCENDYEIGPTITQAKEKRRAGMPTLRQESSSTEYLRLVHPGVLVPLPHMFLLFLLRQLLLVSWAFSSNL